MYPIRCTRNAQGDGSIVLLCVIKIPFKTKGMEKHFDGSYKLGTTKLVYKFDKKQARGNSPLTKVPGSTRLLLKT